MSGIRIFGLEVTHSGHNAGRIQRKSVDGVMHEQLTRWQLVDYSRLSPLDEVRSRRLGMEWVSETDSHDTSQAITFMLMRMIIWVFDYTLV